MFLQTLIFWPICKHANAQLCKVCKCVAQKFLNLVAGSTILSTIGQVSLSHPRDPLLKNSIKEISFFPRGRKYRGNIVPNLQSSDPWPTSSDAGPYLHRDSIGEMEGGWGYFRAQNLMSAQWFVVSHINTGSFLTNNIQELSLRSHLAKTGPWSLIFTL